MVKRNKVQVAGKRRAVPQSKQRAIPVGASSTRSEAKGRAKAPKTFVIQVCQSLICKLKRAANLQASIEETVKTKVQEKYEGAKFCIGPVGCLGFCKEAPALLINGQPFTRMTPEKVSTLVAGIAAAPGTHDLREASTQLAQHAKSIPFQ